MLRKRYVSYLRVSTTKQGETGLGVDPQREAVRRYDLSHHGEQIAELVKAESGGVFIIAFKIGRAHV